MTDHTVNQDNTPVEDLGKKKQQPISQPTIKRKVTLNTASTQNIMRYNFSRLEFALFQLDVSLLFTEQASVVGDYERATKQAYDNLKAELEAAIQNTLQVAESHGIPDDVFYENAQEYTLTIRSPRAISFLNLISLLDQLVIAVDNLWINDPDLVGGNFGRIEHHREWQQRLTKFMREIIRFQIRRYRQLQSGNATGSTGSEKNNQVKEPEKQTNSQESSIGEDHQQDPLAEIPTEEASQVA